MKTNQREYIFRMHDGMAQLSHDEGFEFLAYAQLDKFLAKYLKSQ